MLLPRRRRRAGEPRSPDCGTWGSHRSGPARPLGGIAGQAGLPDILLSGISERYPEEHTIRKPFGQGRWTTAQSVGSGTSTPGDSAEHRSAPAGDQWARYLENGYLADSRRSQDRSKSYESKAQRRNANDGNTSNNAARSGNRADSAATLEFGGALRCGSGESGRRDGCRHFRPFNTRHRIGRLGRCLRGGCDHAQGLVSSRGANPRHSLDGIAAAWDGKQRHPNPS